MEPHDQTKSDQPAKVVKTPGESLKLFKPIPQRNPVNMLQTPAFNYTPMMPTVGGLDKPTSNTQNEGKVPFGTATLPINNLVYMLSQPGVSQNPQNAENQNQNLAEVGGVTSSAPQGQNILAGLKRAKGQEDDDSSSNVSQDPPKKGKKLKKERNRQAAIECRKKRKEYVASLEETIKRMEHEIVELKTKLNIYEQADKFKVISEKDSIFSYLAGRDERYDELQKLVDDYDSNIEVNQKCPEMDKKLQRVVNMIQYRHASTGMIRRQCTSYLFKKILEKVVPSHVRYLCYSCLAENGYFQKIRGRKLAKASNPVKERGKFGEFIEKAKDPENHIWKEVNEVGLNEEQIRTLKKAKGPVTKLRDKICKEMHKLLEIRKKLMVMSQEMETIFDKTGEIMTPIQQARFLLYIDKVKNRKELSVFELWGVKRNGFKITKRIKKHMGAFPSIKCEYDMIVRKKSDHPKADQSEDHEIADFFQKHKESIQEPAREKTMRLSQDSADSKELEWSVDSGCPDSDTEEVE